MGILDDLTTMFTGLNIPCEIGGFTSQAPDTYVVFLPISDSSLWGEDTIDVDVETCLLSIYIKTNYTTLKKTIIDALLQGGFAISDRRFIEFETDTKYYHYEITCEKPYPYEEPEREE